jgi:hypothetical protein
MGLFSLDGDQALSLLKRYLPGSLAVGASAAGLKHLGGMLYQMEKDKKDKQERGDVLTVQIPQGSKMAASIPAAAAEALERMAAQAAHAGESGAATIIPTPALSRTAKAMQAIKSHKLITGGAIAGAGATGMGQAKDWDDNKGAPSEPPPSLWDSGGIASTIMLGGLGGYSLVDHFIKKRQKKNLEEQLDDSKREYSQLLGASLVKGASVEPSFPIISGICSYKVERGDRPQKEAAAALTRLIGIPTGAAAVSAILAHRWMYERQKELEKLHTESKPTPPKQIRLVSAPPEAPTDDTDDGEKPLALGFDKGAAAMPDWFEFFNKVPAAPDEQALRQTQKQQEEDEKKQPKMTNIAPGTVQVSLRDGPVEILAEDPRAAKILSKASPRLTKLLAAFQSTPADLR